MVVHISLSLGNSFRLRPQDLCRQEDNVALLALGRIYIQTI